MGDKTLNNTLGYVNAVYNFLSKNGMIGYPNPLQAVDKIRIHEKELIYLTREEISTLFLDIRQKCINPHVYMITKICLSTGARWGEIESRKDHHFKDNQVYLTYTKSAMFRKKVEHFCMPREQAIACARNTKDFRFFNRYAEHSLPNQRRTE